MAQPELGIWMDPGQTLEVSLEIDLEHSTNFKDWSLVVQGEEGKRGVTLTPLDAGMTSDEWP